MSLARRFAITKLRKLRRESWRAMKRATLMFQLQRIRVEGMNFYRLKNGRVADIWTQFDDVGMMQQLGAIPG